MKVHAMTGYALHNYTQDVRDGFLDLQFPYIIVMLGTMQIALFDAKKVHREVFDFLKALNERNKNSHVLFSGLVPRPIDYPRSRVRCENYSRAYQLAVEDNRRKHGWNCSFIDVQLEFLTKDDKIKDQRKYFMDDLFLSVDGVQLLRACWL